MTLDVVILSFKTNKENNMKKLVLSLIAMFAISTSAIADWYPKDGPDSYNAQSGNNYVEGVTRKGFRLGLGVGAANTKVDDLFYNGDYSESGLATTFEIGYAPNNQFSINYLNNVNWNDSVFDDRSGVSAVALNYYIDNAVDTLYLVGGVGAGVIDGDDEVAGLIGIGYAFDKLEFEVDAVFGQYNDRDMSQVFFTVSYLFY